MTQTPKRALIIGAGPGGLASAMLLAHAGVEVDVFESKPHVGGRTSSFTLDGGYQFDLGPTFFLYTRVLEELYRTVGRELRDEVELRRVDPQYRLTFGPGEEWDAAHIDASGDLERMSAEIARLSPGDADGFARYMADNTEKLARFRPVLEKAFESWLDLVDPAFLKALPYLRPTASLDKDLQRHFSDPRVRLGFTFQSKYLGMSPFRCPSLFTIVSHLEYAYGVWHPVGGCAEVSRNMARIAAEEGARIHLDTPVRELIFEGKRVVGVRTDDGEHRADAVIVNADFAHAMTNLVPEERRRAWTDKKLEKKKYSCSTFMLYLGLDGLYEDLPHHNIYIPGQYKEVMKDIEERHVLSEHPAVYVQNASVTDPTLAPNGRSTLYVLVPVTHETPNVDWTREAPRYREVVLDTVQEAFGLPDLRERIRSERIVTPDDWRDSYSVYKGATFNLAHGLDQMLHLRPRNRFADVPGMYLVGGGTHPGSGLPVIYEGARITSKLVTRDLGVPMDWTVPEAPPRPAAEPDGTRGYEEVA